MIEILAEPTLVDHHAEIAVGRGDPAHVDLERAAAADALEAALLQDAQELGLELGLELADLVEEERAAVGQLEPAALALGRAGERALLVAEQLALEQLLAQRGAVDRHERPRLARALGVDRARRH